MGSLQHLAEGVVRCRRLQLQRYEALRREVSRTADAIPGFSESAASAEIWRGGSLCRRAGVLSFRCHESAGSAGALALQVFPGVDGMSEGIACA
jgi:hypothetical protein